MSDDGADRIVLIGGGVRSGKSDFALSLAIERYGACTLVATAQAFDDEMRARIEAHRASRPKGVQTVEEPVALVDALSRIEGPVVVDCLTLWISNLLMEERIGASVEERIDALLAHLESTSSPTFLVTNEVGMGVVPESALGRRFRDLAGRTHQRIASRADAVYVGMMGLILRLSPEPLAVVEKRR